MINVLGGREAAYFLNEFMIIGYCTTDVIPL